MVVVLNNGTIIKVSQSVCNTIRDNILREKGAAPWQIFNSDSGEATQFFALAQVSAIVDEKQIIRLR